LGHKKKGAWAISLNNNGGEVNRIGQPKKKEGAKRKGLTVLGTLRRKRKAPCEKETRVKRKRKRGWSLSSQAPKTSGELEGPRSVEKFLNTNEF